jgi:hypothetical protein
MFICITAVGPVDSLYPSSGGMLWSGRKGSKEQLASSSVDWGGLWSGPTQTMDYENGIMFATATLFTLAMIHIAINRLQDQPFEQTLIIYTPPWVSRSIRSLTVPKPKFSSVEKIVYKSRLSRPHVCNRHIYNLGGGNYMIPLYSS